MQTAMKVELPQTILLDLDDTILANEINKAECWNQVGKEFAGTVGQIGIEEMIAAINKQNDWFWSDPDRHRIWRQDIERARRVIVEAALDYLGIDDTVLADRIADRFSQLREAAIHPIPGAIDTIRIFQEKGLKLALVTNGSSVTQRKKISRFGLEDLFDHIFIEGEQGFGKPDERIYIRALSQLNSKPNESWMIGDNIVWDVIAPQKLGIKGIWIDNKNGTKNKVQRPEPYFSIESLSQIIDYIY